MIVIEKGKTVLFVNNDMRYFDDLKNIYLTGKSLVVEYGDRSLFYHIKPTLDWLDPEVLLYLRYPDYLDYFLWYLKSYDPYRVVRK